jgi:protein-S-isoprenylcysteine O-methyltransferase Ste14
MAAEPDRPRILAPPPLIFGIFFAAGYGLDRLMPAAPFAAAQWTWIGSILFVAALVLAGAAIGLFLRARTHVEPWKPATTLVIAGPYRRSRNPMYVAAALAHAGAALVLDLPWTLGLLAPALVAIHCGVVRREERYLAARFGDGYADYCRAVRRWL